MTYYDPNSLNTIADLDKVFTHLYHYPRREAVHINLLLFPDFHPDPEVRTYQAVYVNALLGHLVKLQYVVWSGAGYTVTFEGIIFRQTVHADLPYGPFERAVMVELADVREKKIKEKRDKQLTRSNYILTAVVSFATVLQAIFAGLEWKHDALDSTQSPQPIERYQAPLQHSTVPPVDAADTTYHIDTLAAKRM